jgi:hypothetical protein
MGLSSRCGLLLAIGLSMGVARSTLSLGTAFRIAQLVNPPANDYPPFKARQYRDTTAAHYNHAARYKCVTGKAHGFAPPSRPSKHKGYPRSTGRFY